MERTDAAASGNAVGQILVSLGTQVRRTEEAAA
jgi:hypothetical protein